MEESALSNEGVVGVEISALSIVEFVSTHLENAIPIGMSGTFALLKTASSTGLIKIVNVGIGNSLCGDRNITCQKSLIYSHLFTVSGENKITVGIPGSNIKGMYVNFCILVLTLHLPVYQSPYCIKQPPQGHLPGNISIMRTIFQCGIPQPF